MPLTPSPKVKPVVLTDLLVPTSLPETKDPLPLKERSWFPTIPESVRSLDETVDEAS